MATLSEPKTEEAAADKTEARREVEYPLHLACLSQPVLRLAGTVSVIRAGRRDLALSEQEWQGTG